MKGLINKISFALILLTASVHICIAIPERPQPQRLVNDYASLFSARNTAVLEQALTAFDDSTSNQIAVVTVKDLEGMSAMEYATQIGLDWKVGNKEFDNGIVLLIKPKTAFSNGAAAISVGYGLEGAIPDAYAKRIIETILIPHFRNNDYFGGTAAACTALMKLASGEISQARERDSSALPSSVIPIFVGIFIFITILATFKGGNRNNGGNNQGRYNRGVDADDIAQAIIIGNILGGHRSRGSSWGGGGSFGGGSFGGGFGGFGGGSFGGGGASGSW